MSDASCIPPRFYVQYDFENETTSAHNFEIETHQNRTFRQRSLPRIPVAQKMTKASQNQQRVQQGDVRLVPTRMSPSSTNAPSTAPFMMGYHANNGPPKSAAIRKAQLLSIIDEALAVVDED
jgi:hypothetical protein